MQFLDLFAGIGGFRTGMELEGHKCVGYVEIDQHARKSYQSIYDTTDEWTREDIFSVTDSEWAELKGKVDVITGGFPCQSFSIAGNRLGFADEEKGQLFFEIIRAARIIKPDYLFLENVKGLVSHDKGNTLKVIIETLTDLGYQIEMEVLNSKYFGVPQNRERIFIVASKKELNKPSFLKGVHDSHTKVDKVIMDILETEPVADRFLKITDIAEQLIVDFETNGYTPKLIPNKVHMDVVGNSSHTNHGSYRILSANGVCATLAARDFKGPKQVLIPRTEIVDGVEKVKYTVRKLTPIEYWRIQGFSDEAFHKAYEVCSYSQLYKQAGNSVSVPVIQAIAKHLK